jgi:hypothetical protein
MKTRTTTTLTTIFVGVALLLAVSAVAAGQESAGLALDVSAEKAEPVPAMALTKICEGKYKSDGEEHVVSQVCPNVRDICTCTADKVKCGGGEISAPEGSTYCEGSCSTKWVASASNLADLELFVDDFLWVLLGEETRFKEP